MEEQTNDFSCIPTKFFFVVCVCVCVCDDRILIHYCVREFPNVSPAKKYYSFSTQKTQYDDDDEKEDESFDFCVVFIDDCDSRRK